MLIIWSLLYFAVFDLLSHISPFVKKIEMKLKFVGIVVTTLQLLQNFVNCDILTSPMVTNWGEWGPFENCSPGKFVIAFQLKTEPWSWLGPLYDDTCLNGIRFYCGDVGQTVISHLEVLPDSRINSTNITENNIVVLSSSVGEWGKWGHIFGCNGEGYAIGFTLRSEEAGTAWLDETAANNLRLLCSGSTSGFIEGDGERFGEWTSPRLCQNHQYFCGLQTQVQQYQGWFGDDTALNNIRVECCNL